MEEPGRLELVAGLREEEVHLPGGSQELGKSQGKDLRRQLQLLEDPTLLPAALPLPTLLLPQGTRVARIHLELGQDTGHHPTLEAPVGQMQPMGHHQDIPEGIRVEPILLLKNLLRKREKRRSEIRAFNCER